VTKAQRLNRIGLGGLIFEYRAAASRFAATPVTIMSAHRDRDSCAAARLFNFRATGFEDSILCEHGLLNAFCGHGFSQHGFAASQRESPGLCQNLLPSSMRRSECRMRDARAGRVCVVKIHTR
jgi:hypothetical protein